MKKKLKTTLWFAVLSAAAIIMAWNGSLDGVAIGVLSLVVLVGANDHEAMIRLFFATKVWVLKEGVVIVTVGITAGAVFGYVLTRVASTYLGTARMPGALPASVAAAVLIGAAVIASLIPAARASRVDVLQALRSE